MAPLPSLLLEGPPSHAPSEPPAVPKLVPPQNEGALWSRTNPAGIWGSCPQLEPSAGVIRTPTLHHSGENGNRSPSMGPMPGNAPHPRNFRRLCLSYICPSSASHLGRWVHNVARWSQLEAGYDFIQARTVARRGAFPFFPHISKSDPSWTSGNNGLLTARLATVLLYLPLLKTSPSQTPCSGRTNEQHVAPAFRDLIFQLKRQTGKWVIYYVKPDDHDTHRMLRKPRER